MSNQLLLYLGSFITVLSVVLAVWAIAAYVFRAMAYHAIAKRRGFKAPWLAWIPYGEYWLMGAIADDYCEKAEYIFTKYRIILLVLQIADTVITSFDNSKSIADIVADPNSYSAGGPSVIAIISSILGIVYCVFYFIALYKIYKSCNPSKAKLYLILSIFLPMTQPFLVYSISKYELGMPEEEVFEGEY